MREGGRWPPWIQFLYPVCGANRSEHIFGFVPASLSLSRLPRSASCFLAGFYLFIGRSVRSSLLPRALDFCHPCSNFFSILAFFESLFKKWTRWKVFSTSDPFESRQSIWRDLWRSHTNLTGMTRGADAWTAADVMPHGLGQLSHATADGATRRRAILWRGSTSHAIYCGATQSRQSDWRD
jgi:hypothetical protein